MAYFDLGKLNLALA